MWRAVGLRRPERENFFFLYEGENEFISYRPVGNSDYLDIGGKEDIAQKSVYSDC